GLAVMVTLATLRADLRSTIFSRHLPLHVFRNTVHLGAQYLWAKSLLLLPLATVFALEFTAPAWALLLALPVLGERMTASRIGAVVLGLMGVLVILRPGLQTFQPAALLVLLAALGYAIALITTKKLTRTDTNFAIIFWMNLIQLPLALLGSHPLFVTKLTLSQLPAAVAVRVSGLASPYCLANAVGAGDACGVVPLVSPHFPVRGWVGWWLCGYPFVVFFFPGPGVLPPGLLCNWRGEAGGASGPSIDRERRVERAPPPAPP